MTATPTRTPAPATADQLRLLHLVEAQDLILLVQGASYEARKAALRALVLQAPAVDAAHAGQVDAHTTHAHRPAPLSALAGTRRGMH